MEFKEIIEEALSTLRINKLRSGLATLGIIIGIGSVIALISLGQSSQKAVQDQIEALGSNLLTIVPGALRAGDFRSTSGTSTTLTLDDAKAILNNPTIPDVKNVSAELLRRSQVTAGRNNTNTQVSGVLPSYQVIRSLDMTYGNFLSDIEEEAGSKVAVLGPTVATNLFGDGVNPIGQSVRITGISFRVIGVTKAKGASGFSNLDDIVYVPLSTAQKQLYGVNYVGSISVEVDNSDNMNKVRDQVGYLLLDRHKIALPANADFTIVSQSDILGALSSVTGAFTGLLSGIAAISLLVGGIGIMNIMLVTVTERTREIGLRKALGAKKQTIIRQFLTEAVILTGVGGTIGMIIGISASFLISKVISLPFTISPGAVILAIGVSAAVGIIFGWYPAKKASDLQPIEALRYE